MAAAATQALVDAAIAAQVGNYAGAGTAMKALYDGAQNLTPTQIVAVLHAVNDPAIKNNQLHGAFDPNVWLARHGQAIVRPFLEKYLLGANALDLAGLTIAQIQTFYLDLSFAAQCAGNYGH